MAKLYVKFENAVLKELTISQTAVTIGRLPDNTLQLDNPAVSGHHAKILWTGDHYEVEDNNSLNGTYVNNARVTRQALKNGDSILVGKHTIAFTTEGIGDRPAQTGAAAKSAPSVPKLEQTVVLDTKKMKDMLVDPSQPKQPNAGPASRVGILNIIRGKTDERRYLLTSKMNVIGKSDMASIKLKGFFAPKMAALISKTDIGYVVSASEQKIKVKVNGEEISGQKVLNSGDTIEVAGVKMAFQLQ